MGEHVDHAAILPCCLQLEVYAIRRTKPGSLKGGNKSPHRVYAATLTKDPTAPELQRDFLFIDMFRGRTQTTWPFLGHFLTPLPPRDISWFFEGPSPSPQMSRVFRKFSGILLYTNNRHRELVKNMFIRNLYFFCKTKIQFKNI